MNLPASVIQYAIKTPENIIANKTAVCRIGGDVMLIIKNINWYIPELIGTNFKLFHHTQVKGHFTPNPSPCFKYRFRLLLRKFFPPYNLPKTER